MAVVGYGTGLIERTLDVLHEIIQGVRDEDIIVFGGIGRFGRVSVYYINQDKVRCGCFWGTLAQFEDQIYREHKDSPQHLQEYLSAVDFLRAARAARLLEPKKEKINVNSDHAVDATTHAINAIPLNPRPPYIGGHTGCGEEVRR